MYANAYSAHEGQKKASNPLELELQVVMSHSVSAGNQILIL